MKFSFKKATREYNDYTLVLKATASTALMTTEISGTEITVNLATTAANVVTTTATDIIKAFFEPGSSGYNAEVVDLISASLVDPDGSGTMPTGTYTFAGGTGSAEVDPTFVPDKAGLYVFSLRVTSGTIYSLTVVHTLQAVVSDQLLQHRPNSEYLFSYLSDFWRLVEDKKQIESYWSAVTQVLSADLVTTWQNDLSKTLKDTSRKYQRRWVRYDMRYELSSTPTLTTPTVYASLDLTVDDTLVGSAQKKVTYTNNQLRAPIAVGKAVVRSSSQSPAIISIVGVKDPNGVGAWELTAATRSFPSFEVVDTNTAGYFYDDPSTSVTPNVSDIFGSPTYTVNGFKTTEKVRLYLDSGTVILPVLSVNPQNLDNRVQLDTAATAVYPGGGLLPVNGQAIMWDYLRKAEGVNVKTTPYFQFPATEDLVAKGLKLGDYLEIEVIDPYTAEEVTAYLPILAVTKDTMFVEWATLLDALEVTAAAQATIEQKLTWKEEDIESLSITAVAYYHAKDLPAVDDLVSVPTLGTTIAPVYWENQDYTVSSLGEVQFSELISGELVVTAGSRTATWSLPKVHPGVFLTGTYSELLAAGVRTVVLERGDAGTYTITNLFKGNAIELDRAPEVSGTFPAYCPRFSAAVPSPHRQWAEVSYLDNWKTIQSNFGAFIGYPKALVDTYDPTIDYLGLVKSVWFAFMNGPTLDNLSLGVQGMFSLPFAEEDGQIVQVDAATEAEDGRIHIRDEQGVVRVFYYPYGATLANNPRTGRSFKAFEYVSDTSNLSAQQLLDLEDATVKAYDRLVDVVNVDDYISNPDLIETHLTGQEIIRKYHTFVVSVPLNVTGSIDPLPLVEMFLDQAKPAHTDFILVGALNFSDDVTITETMTLAPTIKLSDSPHTSAFSARAVGVGAFGQPVVPAADELLLWPEEKTKAKYGKIPSTVGVTNGSAFVDTPVDLTSYIDANVTLQIDNGGAFVSYSVLSVSATQITLTAAYTGTTYAAREIWVTLQDADVKEKYESGYVEGVLDDYSGDGSWNQRFSMLDPVNSLDSDIDVVGSYIWVPILKSTGGAQDDVEFAVGELVDIADNTTQDTGSIWFDSPPIVVHVGAGEHPKIPFDTYSPQNLHPNTYLILGFDHQSHATLNNYGHESRLDAITEAVGRLAGPVRLLGRTSGALGTPDVYIDRTKPAHSKYFMLEYIYSADKLSELNPASLPALQVTRYIPEPGDFVDTIQQNNGPFDTDNVTNTKHYLTAIKHSQQVQQYPYDPGVAADQQFVPSLGTGIYMDWDLSGEPGPPTKANYLWRFGYNDVGDLPTTPTAITAFTPDPNAKEVQNTHVGLRIAARKDHGYTHGFTKFSVPAPVIKRVTAAVGVYDVRVEGFYFVDDDSTRVLVPDDTPSSFDGSYGGAWVFLRQVSTGTEIAVVSWVFETGLNAGKLVLGVDGAVQTSTGHVIEFVVPPLPAAGVYDIIVRNYRPWQMKSGGTQLYHMDEAVAEEAYVYSASGGYTGPAWGTGGWGT